MGQQWTQETLEMRGESAVPRSVCPGQVDRALCRTALMFCGDRVWSAA